jgi:orotate phosphoribosyltransferase-like protein
MPRGKPSKNSKQQAQARAKDREALELRKAGATYQQIADKLGISLSGAGVCVSRAMEALRLEVNEKAEEVLQLELDRLDHMLLGLWDAARRGNTAAIDRVLKIQDRRAKYLGLDKQTAPTVTMEAEDWVPLWVPASAMPRPKGDDE